MLWNAAAFDLVGGPGDEIAVGSLPAAVREWFRYGGDERMAAVCRDNLIARAGDLRVGGKPLVLESDGQGCGDWTVDPGAGEDDPPVSFGGSRYADHFSEYVYARLWETLLWRERDTVTEFDHRLPEGAIAGLGGWLRPLPTTYGWALNQGCDATYRFEGDARVAVAVSGGVAVWSVVAARSPEVREHFARMVGAL
ncbi:hypothetical protein FHR83_006200 [Actinoplanes campanulatus]|uniref:Uncharacterized protein n=1 Tax=Actinoplanes campanulatus TaxID=113559 RepID=A0A7W5FHE9_9ACTN|nr:hypothetical protein [Actinoplanes campanulatus]MBB3098501.1 hypothetical protein [Actinoplanes campanulatus]GGN35559.1 hypothetical protein GCM10010109_59720 [Actinoplanes campanulatus]GID39195.1 hypothetical protein Aca09nite_57010 [Actinoplanes campanulatus]